MAEAWDICRKLNNPERLELLKRVYTAAYGLNIGLAQDSTSLGQSGVSQYMKQLEALGLVKRERSGRFVNYHPELQSGSLASRALVPLLMERFRVKNPDLSFTRAFPALMNPLRARIVALLAKSGILSPEAICDKFNIQSRHLARHMKPILDCALAKEEPGAFVYIPQSDPIVNTIIEQS